LVPLRVDFGAEAGRKPFDTEVETLPDGFARDVSALGAAFRVVFDDGAGRRLTPGGTFSVTFDYEDLGLVAGAAVHERMFLRLPLRRSRRTA
jgi:hypothetical protein